MSLQAQLQAASGEYQKLQADLSVVVDAREKLDAQLAENDAVKVEFNKLTQSNTVYKLIGPVLVKQDQAEAKSNVDKRLEFIRSEIKRVEGQIKDINVKSDKTREKLGELQTSLEKQQQEQQAA